MVGMFQCFERRKYFGTHYLLLCLCFCFMSAISLQHYSCLHLMAWVSIPVPASKDTSRVLVCPWHFLFEYVCYCYFDSLSLSVRCSHTIYYLRRILLVHFRCHPFGFYPLYPSFTIHSLYYISNT